MKKPALIQFFVFVLATSFTYFSAFASDHIDGPVTTANPVADLTDLFAFQTPGVNHSLTFIMDVYPFVSSTGHFSDKLVYNLILRRAYVAADQSHFETDAQSELVISCRFVTPNTNSNIQIVCQSNDLNHRIKAQVSFNQVAPDLVGNNFQLFAGRRSDPFFLSEKFASQFMKFQKTKPDGVHILSHLNCLSIVMNVKTDLLFPLMQTSSKNEKKNKARERQVAQAEDSLIAVAVESVTTDVGVSRRIDRIGRPEVTNISMNMNSAASGGEIRDSYNADRPFEVPKEKSDQYIARLKQNIGRYDMIDQRQDWSSSQLTQLATILADDFLVLNPSISCAQSQYFSIERSMLKGAYRQSCGGRDPNDNVTNKLYTLYEHGLANPEEVSADAQDGLLGPTAPISKQFPYLAPPDESPLAALKNKLSALAVLFGK